MATCEEERKKDVVTMHHAPTPEIDITSETTAKGIWYLRDTVLNLMESTEKMRGKSVQNLRGKRVAQRNPVTDLARMIGKAIRDIANATPDIQNVLRRSRD